MIRQEQFLCLGLCHFQTRWEKEGFVRLFVVSLLCLVTKMQTSTTKTLQNQIKTRNGAFMH